MSRPSRPFGTGFVGLLAVAVAAALPSPTAASVKGRPADRYTPLADWAGVAPVIQADPEAIASFDSPYAKIASVAGRSENDRLLIRVRFERPLETYFASLPANTLVSTYGVFLHLSLDTDANDRTGTSGQGPEQGTDLEAQISGSTGTDGTYRVLGWYRALDEKGEPTDVKGSFRVDRQDIAYGVDTVEIAIPRSALPARSGGVFEIVASQQVEVGDREAAVLKGTWSSGGGPAAKQDAAVAQARLRPASQPSRDAGPAAKASPGVVAAAFQRGLQAIEKDDRAKAEAAQNELLGFGTAALPFCEDRVKKGTEFEKAMALDLIFAMGEAAAPAVPTVISATADASEMVRGQAAWALSRIDRSRAGVLKLAALLKDKGPSVRWKAAEGLKFLGASAEPALTSLTEATADPTEGVADYACGALANIHSHFEVTIPALVKGLQGPSALSCVTALGELGREARPAVPHVVQLVKTAAAAQDTWMGHTAAVALGRIGGPEAKGALPALEQLHGMMDAMNTKQDLADVIYKLKAVKSGGSD